MTGYTSTMAPLAGNPGLMIGLTVLIALLALTLVAGGILIVTLAFYSKRQQDEEVGGHAPSDEGLVLEQLRGKYDERKRRGLARDDDGRAA